MVTENERRREKWLLSRDNNKRTGFMKENCMQIKTNIQKIQKLQIFLQTSLVLKKISCIGNQHDKMNKTQQLLNKKTEILLKHC